MAKKWLDSIEKQKRRIDLKFVRDKQTDIHTYRRTDRQSQRQKNKTPSLGAAINLYTSVKCTKQMKYATVLS